MVAGFGTPLGTRAWPGVPLQRTTKVQVVPAPVGGLNLVTPLVATEPSYCLVATNLVATGQGMRVRSGHTAYASDVDLDGIRTVIPFEGAAESALFAVSPNGIYDVSSGGAGPWVAEVSFPSASEPAGWGTWTNFTADSGLHYAFYADEQNGLYRRLEGGSFAAVTDITGVSELALTFVTQHMSRVWFVEDGTALAWYLVAGNIAGPATSFNFGSKFNHGGTLKGLYSWTVDGGEGIDDHLVAIGSGGDVLVYKGTDPTSAATWQLVGQYYVGRLPAGRRIAQNEGGDLYILCQYGVIPLTRLLQGTLVQDAQAQLSRNISPLIAEAMALTISSRGWEMRNVPSENAFLVARPAIGGFENLQFSLSSHTNGWTTFEGLPYQTADVWDGDFYIGGADGTVYLFAGNVDIDEAIPFGLLSSFQEYGETGLYHRVQFMRPVFRSTGSPAYTAEARYDYNTDPPTSVSAAPVLTGSLWDVALWDSAIWAASGAVVQSVIGATGIGRAMAMALAGTSDSETLFIRTDIMFDSAGPL
jgi:hypothetical protein